VKRTFPSLTLLVIALGFGLAPLTAQDDLLTYEEDAIRFSYPLDLASAIEVAAIPANLPQETPFPNPAFLQFTFVDYAGLAPEDIFHAPRLEVYQTADFAAFADPNFNEFTADGQLRFLQQLLAERPDLSLYTENLLPVGSVENSLPFIPTFNASQVLRAQAEYLDFQNGTGLRYLTYYSQAVNPITDSEIFYTFQGLSNDGSVYVVAILPVQTGLFPTLDEVDYSTLNYDAFATTYETYLREANANLNALDPRATFPSLEVLDALIESITVNP
jgi:hypothetical protein